MESTSSVAQGIFLFLPDGFSLSKLKKSRKRKLEDKTRQKWESAFNKIWNVLHREIKDINEQLFSKVLKELIEHLKKLHNDKLSEGVIPCEILLTGTNLPDHRLLLSTFINNITAQITPYVASLRSWNCGNIKSTVHNFVSQILPYSKYGKKTEDTDEDEDDIEMDVDEDLFMKDGLSENNSNKKRLKIPLQMSQYNLSVLSSWYCNIQCKDDSIKKPVIVIIPDFESFSPSVLGEFILLLSAYSSKIPFILVFGVATTPVAVYQNLSRNVLSQLVIQLFQSERSVSLLNNVIENVLFSERCPFRLGEKCMNFLTDIFLFHSFSVHDFIQGFKYCMIEHFYKRNHFALCCSLEEIEEQSSQLSAEELESIRKLSSFQKFVENSEKNDRKLLLLNDDHTRETAKTKIEELLDHSRSFHFALKILHVLTSDLPKHPLGRNLREYYCKCLSCNVQNSKEYKECMKLLELQSQNEFITKINKLIKILSPDDGVKEKSRKLGDILVRLEEFRKLFSNIGNGSSEEDQLEEKETENDFEVLRKKFLKYVEDEVVKNLVQPPTDLPLYEIIYFDDITAVRRRISGSPRGAIHLALNNPQCYLNCKCCDLSTSEAILPTLPDLSIAYKIHLEHNKLINMYDWLQSFAATVKENSSASEEVDQEIQARFTRAVSELQFLGFIKPSRAKTDHVSRLTWENS